MAADRDKNKGAPFWQKWREMFKSGFLHGGDDPEIPPPDPVYVKDVRHRIQWSRNTLEVEIILSGKCCDGCVQVNDSRNMIQSCTSFNQLDAGSDGGLSVLKANIKSSVLAHLEKAQRAAGGLDSAGCNLFLDGERDIPSWALALIVERYGRLRDEANATESRKLLRDGERKVDQTRVWLEDPLPHNSHYYHYLPDHNASKVNRHRNYEAFQKFLYKTCHGSMPKVKRLFADFVRQHGWDDEALMTYRRRDEVHRALACVERARSVVAVLRSKSHTKSARTSLGVIVSALCPTRVDPERPDNYMNEFFKDLGVKRFAKLKWALAALETRWTFDAHDERVSQLPPTIEEGEAVHCRGGEGGLVDRCLETGKATVRVYDTNALVSWDREDRAGARLKRAPASLVPARKKGVDARSVRAELRRSIMADFLLKENVQSPNKKDVVRRWVGYNTKEEKLIVWRMVPWDTLWLAFKSDPAHAAIVEHYAVKGESALRAPPSFIAAAPWWMRKGKHEACLCLICEELACKYHAQCSAVRRLTQMLKEMDEGCSPVDGDTRELTSQMLAVLDKRSKTEMCTEIVKPCLPNGKLEEAKGCCERGECGNCGFSLLWSKLRAKIVHNKEVGGEMLEEFRDDGVHESWKEKMLCRTRHQHGLVLGCCRRGHWGV